MHELDIRRKLLLQMATWILSQCRFGLQRNVRDDMHRRPWKVSMCSVYAGRSAHKDWFAVCLGFLNLQHGVFYNPGNELWDYSEPRHLLYYEKLMKLRISYGNVPTWLIDFFIDPLELMIYEHLGRSHKLKKI